MWPQLQAKARSPPFKPPISNIANGDLRVNNFMTSYKVQFRAPFEASGKICSPMRNPDLAVATDLKPLYQSSFNRVTECVEGSGGVAALQGALCTTRVRLPFAQTLLPP